MNMATMKDRIDAAIEQKNHLNEMFEALNNFLNREGDRHFNPDFFDDRFQKWSRGETLETWEIGEVSKLYRDWIKQ